MASTEDDRGPQGKAQPSDAERQTGRSSCDKLWSLDATGEAPDPNLPTPNINVFSCDSCFHK